MQADGVDDKFGVNVHYSWNVPFAIKPEEQFSVSLNIEGTRELLTMYSYTS